MATGMWLRSRTVATLAVMECLASVIFVVLWDVWSPIIKLDNAGVTTTHLALKLPEKKKYSVGLLAQKAARERCRKRNARERALITKWRQTIVVGWRELEDNKMKNIFY